MNRKIKNVIIGVALALSLTGGAVGLAGCSNETDTVNENLSKEADNFEVLRRVVFYNAIKGEYIMTVEGYCSVDPGDGVRMGVTCKVGDRYKRNAMGKSDNVMWMYEQLGTSGVSKDHYKVIFRPQTIIPDIEAR